MKIETVRVVWKHSSISINPIDTPVTLKKLTSIFKAEYN